MRADAIVVIALIALVGSGCARYVEPPRVRDDASVDQTIVGQDAAGDGAVADALRGDATVDLFVDGAPLSDGNSSCVYAYRRKIRLDTTQVDQPLTDFPLVLELEGNWLRTRGVDAAEGRLESPAGWDFRFRAEDPAICGGSAPCTLVHETEYQFLGNASLPGRMVVWIKLPSLTRDTALRADIFIEYGNSCIGSPTDRATAVWDDDYAAIWHLREQGSGAIDEFRDSTRHGNHGRGGGGKPARVPARIEGALGFCQYFDGVPGDGDFVWIDTGGAAPSLNADVMASGALTLSAWVKMEVEAASLPDYARIIDKWYDKSGGYGLFFNPGALRIGINTAGLDGTAMANTDSLFADHNFTAGAWHHVVGTYDVGGAKKRRIYFDGILIDERDVSLASLDTGAREVTIGGDNGVDASFQGWIDEVRISRVVHPGLWIKLSFLNQQQPRVGSGGLFSTLGNEELL